MTQNAPHRFFSPDLSGDLAELAPTESHHAQGVLRMGRGDEVELFDGQGNAALGVIEKSGKGSIFVRVTSRRALPQRPQPWVELAFAVPKGKRLDWLLEKAAELGAAGLAPVEFERSVVTPDLGEHARSRWEGICVSAAKQCRADYLPQIHEPVSLKEYLPRCSCPIKLIGDPQAAIGLGQALATWQSGQAIALLVGPEGGMTEAEMQQAREAGFAGIRLGQTILRVETACLALLAAANVLCQER